MLPDMLLICYRRGTWVSIRLPKRAPQSSKRQCEVSALDARKTTSVRLSNATESPPHHEAIPDDDVLMVLLLQLSRLHVHHGPRNCRPGSDGLQHGVEWLQLLRWLQVSV